MVFSNNCRRHTVNTTIFIFWSWDQWKILWPLRTLLTCEDDFFFSISRFPPKYSALCFTVEAFCVSKCELLFTSSKSYSNGIYLHKSHQIVSTVPFAIFFFFYLGSSNSIDEYLMTNGHICSRAVLGGVVFFKVCGVKALFPGRRHDIYPCFKSNKTASYRYSRMVTG